MRVKCNFPLSDNEMNKVKSVLTGSEKISVETTMRIADIFPYTYLNITGDVIYIGKPPWDMTQEVTIF